MPKRLDPSTVPEKVSHADVAHLEPGAKDTLRSKVIESVLERVHADGLLREYRGTRSRKAWLPEWRKDYLGFKKKAEEGMQLATLLRASEDVGAESKGQPDVTDTEKLKEQFHVYVDNYKRESFVEDDVAKKKGPLTSLAPSVEIFQIANDYAFRAWDATRLAIGIIQMQVGIGSWFALNTSWRIKGAAFKRMGKRANELHMRLGATEIEGVEHDALPLYRFDNGTTPIVVVSKRSIDVDPDLSIFKINVNDENHELWVIGKGPLSIAVPLSDILDKHGPSQTAIMQWGAGSAGTRHIVFNPPTPRGSSIIGEDTLEDI